jgi:hypothetical protein
MNHEIGRAVPCALRQSKEPPRFHGSAHGVTCPILLPAWPLLLLLAAIAAGGCKSTSLSTYISPRVTGRVIAADTRQPLADVKVRRVNPAAAQDYDEPARGGQRIESVNPVRTDSQGRFVLDAERDLTLLQQQVWFSVMVSFQHNGYLTMRTNFTVSSITTNAPDGAPVVNAGDILLRPLSR